MKLVIDASVILKWFFADAPSETDTDKARALLPAAVSGRIALLQPPHWVVEVLAVIARRTPTLVDQALTMLGTLGVELVADEAAYRAAAELSIRLKQHVFDTLYHAVALKHGAAFVTADERYFTAGRREGSIEMLANFKLV